MPHIEHSKSKIFFLYWLPLIAACAAIFIQSSFRGPERMPEVRFLDKLLHFGAYAVLAILFYRAYETLPLKNNRILLIFFSIISAILYGISDEIHQYFVLFRHADLMDVVANTIGSISGVFLYNWWKRRQKKPLNGSP